MCKRRQRQWLAAADLGYFLVDPVNNRFTFVKPFALAEIAHQHGPVKANGKVPVPTAFAGLLESSTPAQESQKGHRILE
jgi:hypothetical protein